MIRSILPVGQGAFYTECFDGGRQDSALFSDRFNIVYDCGSSTKNGSVIKEEIRHHFEKDEVIEGVFISHLDDDHINGLPYLLDYCHVKRVFFPLLTKDALGIVRTGLSAWGSRGLARSIFENPQDVIDRILDNYPDLRLYGVGEDGIDDYDLNSNMVRIIRPGDDAFSEENVGRINNGVFWEFIPFNYRNETRIAILLEELEKQFERKISSDEVETLWRDPSNRAKIKEAYKKVPGGLNTNTMVLFSGIKNAMIRQYPIIRPCCCYCYGFAKPVGCLYTGDYDASGVYKWRKLKEAYKEYWDYIGCFQVPHHGSSHSFNHELADMDVYSFISAGYSNQYRHPHSKVIKSFYMRGRRPFLVTDQPGSALSFQIE